MLARLGGGALPGRRTTHDADAAVARAVELGGSVVMPATDVFDAGRSAVLADAEGAGSPDGPAVMAEAVRTADRLARPGDTVLMAPAAASMDQFRSYAQRGEAFIDAVAALMAEHGWDVDDAPGA